MIILIRICFFYQNWLQKIDLKYRSLSWERPIQWSINVEHSLWLDFKFIIENSFLDEMNKLSLKNCRYRVISTDEMKPSPKEKKSLINMNRFLYHLVSISPTIIMSIKKKDIVPTEQRHQIEFDLAVSHEKNSWNTIGIREDSI